jgi:uncharacterized protein (TIGR03663 family)
MSGSGRVGRVHAAVVALAAIALLARLVGLGDRPFHWGEARVGVWALRFVRTGLFEYRPVAGGPLPYHLARASLALFGPTDTAARLPVAVVGGLLPLSALGLRGRLRDRETVLLAAALALSPTLVYYGRVLRGDLLLAAAAFVACVLVVRAVDSRRVFAYGAALAAAAALAASGFVVATLACVVAALVVVADARRLSLDALGGVSTWLREWSALLARLFLVFVVAVVFLFAPRGGDVALWSPVSFLDALAFVFDDAPGRFVAVRVVSRSSADASHPLLPFVVSLGRTLSAAALPTVALAGFGALHERYTGENRPVVAFFAVWAAVGVVVFPVVAEVDAPWTAVHVVVPLAVPAAVGAARVVSYARTAASADDAATVAAVLLFVVAGVAQVGGVLADEVYGQPTVDDALVDDARPADDLKPFAADVSAVRVPGREPTVLYYGDQLHTARWTEADGPPVPPRWSGRLPLPWYVARENASARSLPSNAAFPPDPPPVVVTGPADAGAIEGRLSAYERSRYRLALWNREAVVFVRRS